MQVAIRRYRLEEQNLKSRLNRISLTGVVGAPAFFYVSALLTTLAGIYEYPNPVLLGATAEQTLFISLVLIVIGSVFLGTGLQAIERVAREEETIPTEIKPESRATPAIAGRQRVSAYYFVDALQGQLGVRTAGIQKVVVDWQRRVAYWFDSRIDTMVREGRIPAFAIPSVNEASVNEDEWAARSKVTLVKRAPRPEELSL
jgi:hypothetical protein